MKSITSASVSTKPRRQVQNKNKLNTRSPIVKSPLKWAGGKRKLVSDIAKLVAKNPRQRLIEPFVGGGSVFLNMNFKQYLLMDSNADLINLFNHIKQDPAKFIECSAKLFTADTNQEKRYYALREQFNQTAPSIQRSVLFLYLNRHGYNGLCRYNQTGGYNVPFGQYKKPYYPEQEILMFAQKSKQAQFHSGDFSNAFKSALPGDIIYCDPPYSPINQTANFTAYSGVGFSHLDQLRLVECALNAQKQGITTIVSNNDLPNTRALYSNADKMIRLNVARTISCKGSVRKPCAELLAVYKPLP